MRQRNKVWAKPYIEESELVINTFKISDLNDCFNNENKEFRLEIGTGKGDFLIGLASKFTNINFIGIEVCASVLVTAVQKAEALKLNNIKFILFDATKLNELLPKHSVSTLYLNFSDPWPKKRHEKRRLTSKTFLEMYKEVLDKDGLIIQKTDNEGLFMYSLESFEENKMNIISKDFDYQFDEINDSMSEYERKFRERNNKIYRAIVKF